MDFIYFFYYDIIIILIKCFDLDENKMFILVKFFKIEVIVCIFFVFFVFVFLLFVIEKFFFYYKIYGFEGR